MGFLTFLVNEIGDIRQVPESARMSALGCARVHNKMGLVDRAQLFSSAAHRVGRVLDNLTKVFADVEHDIEKTLLGRDLDNLTKVFVDVEHDIVKTLLGDGVI